MNLDEDQKKVVELNEGKYAILAGAGAGKSTVLLHRAGRLYDGTKKIACVTFTSEAAKNLRDRAVKLFPNLEPSVFSTLHSLALRFATQHPDAFPFRLADFPIAEELTVRAVYDAIGDTINFRAFRSWVSLQKRNMVSPAEAVKQAAVTGTKFDHAIGYQKYQELLRKQGILDFDDLIYYMVDILKKRPDIRSLWQFDYVMQDEAQDACELDWKLLQLITEKHGNILCVGDSGQAIYGFRGGASHHLMNMDEMFPGTQIFILGTNYRSLATIVEAGKKAYPYPSIATLFRSIRAGLGSVKITPYGSEFRQAEEVISKAKSYVVEETVVLARTNLALRAFEEECLVQGVQYHLLGDSGFWESPEVENILHYLRAIVFRTDAAILAAIKTPFWPTKYVKKKMVVEKLKAYTSKGLTAYEAIDHISELAPFRDRLHWLSYIRNKSCEIGVQDVIKSLDAIEHYSGEENVNPDRNPVQNLRELVRASTKYGTVAEFLDFIRRISHARRQRKGLCLSTIHQAKGKEWKNVFLVSANEGIIPHIKADDITEEKCCFFVGVSRAEDTLHISFYDTPSRFLQPFLKVEDELSLQECGRAGSSGTQS